MAHATVEEEAGGETTTYGKLEPSRWVPNVQGVLITPRTSSRLRLHERKRISQLGIRNTQIQPNRQSLFATHRS